jgi:hypothetical protein
MIKQWGKLIAVWSQYLQYISGMIAVNPLAACYRHTIQELNTSLDTVILPRYSIYHHHKPINIPTTGAQVFLMD